MKTTKKILLCVGIVVSAGLAAKHILNSIDYSDEDTVELLDKVVVQKINLDLNDPSNVSGQLLFTRFVNTSYVKQFGSISQDHWRSKWRKLRKRLLATAKKNKFDEISLDKSLEKIRPGLFQRKAILPVGAFLGRKGSDKVWIIPCVWEANMYGNTIWGEAPVALSHVRVYAFRVEDAEQVGFATCS